MYWQSFVDRFYAPGGVLRQGVWNPQVGSKQFEISTPALARYYLTQYTSGIRQIQMVVEGARERDMPNGGHMVESPRTSFIYWFTNDCQVCLVLCGRESISPKCGTDISSSSLPMVNYAPISTWLTNSRCWTSL
jgi:hypothetical protein